ncbi:MAG: type II toxin-antitoxin system HicA family toxin [Methanotrichaceae archaeon]|nr:type II toxin-antitoxin system HicA family toxin [Methanotrichaceae archaeon]
MPMPKLPAISPQKLGRALEKAGFELMRVKGSHHYYYNLQTGKIAVVPFHSKDIRKGTLHAIVRAAGINIEELLDLI